LRCRAVLQPVRSVVEITASFRALALCLLAALVLCAGCTSTVPREAPTPACTVTYVPDQHAVPVPIVNGVPYPMSDAERQRIGQAFVDAYCPAALD